jgi:class 3 adenylate cyclase/tetratricopeptide (TPR) repeat protein
VRTCSTCHRENPDDAKFCADCGSPLVAATETREERKVVTVLFADLVGFTSRSEQLDPEDVRATLTPYFARLRDELERRGGTVEKFIGDAVMAVFGAPATHEDDPERAVRAALAIREWAREQEGLKLRIAVNTGEALVSLGAHPGEGIVAGDVVNTAARLQALAATNGILVGETTYRSTRDRIEYRLADAVEAKGKAEPISVWEALEARSRVEVERSASAPLVGREGELDTLRDALARAKQRRQQQLVTLVGVPGIGKSRLVYELFRAIEEDEELVYWRRGRSLPYGEGVSFWALGEIVKAQAGILESDSPDDAHEKLERTAEALLDERDAGWVTGHLGSLLGSAGEAEVGEDRRDEAFAAWRRFLEALAEDRPLVLVFEDLHWADEGLLDFVDHLVDWAEGVPLLILCTARPELLVRRPGWGGGRVNAATVLLEPLSDDETARLVDALLGRSVLPAGLRTSVLDRAGGNPLYAEEFVRLLDEERPDVELPESVQGIIAARLDVLAPDEKQLLQDAAVAGRAFWAGELAAVGDRDARRVERVLHALARREFVQRERRSSVAGDTQYVFRHALLRDVAYGQIPRADRGDKHRRAAEWIESLGRPEDHAEMLAHHYMSALQYARGAGADTHELTEPARQTFRDAGERAVALNAFSSGVRFFEAALDLWPKQGAAYPALVFSLATALHRSGDVRAQAMLERAAELLEATGDRGRAGEAHALLAELAYDLPDRERVDAELARARELVRGAVPSASVARVLSQVSRYRMLAGDLDDAIEVGRAALSIAEQLGLEEVKAHALNNIGSARVRNGDPGGIEDLERSIEVAMAANSPEAARAYHNLAEARFQTFGELERNEGLTAEALRVAERLGNVRQARYSRGVLNAYAYLGGRWDEYLTNADEFLAESERVGRSYKDMGVFAIRPLVLLARGEGERSYAEALEGLSRARNAGEPQAVVPALVTLGQVELELGRFDDARQHAREAIASTILPGDLVRVTLLAERLGIEDELRAALADVRPSRWVDVAGKMLERDHATVADELAEMGHRSMEAPVRLRAAEHLAAHGRRAEADQQLNKALAFYRSVGATRYIGQAEGLLAATA